MPRIPKVIKKRAQAAMGQAVVRTLDTIPKVTRHLPHAKRRRQGLTIWQNIPYRDSGDAAHLLDVFRLEGAPSPQPALLYAHGGGFSACSKETHIGLAIAFARRGFTVFNINYRLGPRHRYPAAFDDVAAALLWVQENASRHGADPSRITLAGESAGANLITSAALAGSYEVDLPWAERLHKEGPKVSAVLAGCGVYQVSDMGRFWRDRDEPTPRLTHGVALAMEEAYLGRLEQAAGGYPLADPVVLLEERAPQRALPPFFVFCGTGDFLIDDSLRLKSALDRHACTAELRTYEGEPHAFHALKWKPAAQACWEHHDAFVEAHLGFTPRTP